LAKILEPFDLVIVIGAEVFRYYPWVAGPVLPPGAKLLQITNDPNDAAKALVGDSLLSDVSLAMNELNRILQSDSSKRSATHAKEHPNHNKELLASHKVADTTGRPMTAYEAFDAAAASRPSNAILVQESPSNYADLVANWPSLQPEHFFTMASGGLGWNAPAAVGIALAQKETSKPTVLVIGDGSLQYSVQSIWSAVQQKVKLVYLVPVNDDYTILKEFAVLENAPNVPGLDLPGLHVTAIAEAYGCRAFTAKTPKEVQQRFQEALQADGPTLIAFPIDRTLRPLIAQSKPGA
jgi:benzoylformate decarboxylase